MLSVINLHEQPYSTSQIEIAIYFDLLCTLECDPAMKDLASKTDLTTSWF